MRCFVAAALANAITAFAHEASSPPVAVPVQKFLQSIGICCHIGQGVDDPALAATALSYIGAHAIRDDASSEPSFVAAMIELHKSSGAKVILTRSGPNETALEDMLTVNLQLARADALLALEGPNEPNNWAVTFNGKTSSDKDSGPIADWQAAYFARAQQNPVLSKLPVFHSSEAGGSEVTNVGLQYLTVPSTAKGVLRPAGTKFATHANVHNYICRKPSLIDNMAWINSDPTFAGWPDSIYGEYGRTWRKNFSGYPVQELSALPRVTTETGWVTAGKDGKAGAPGTLSLEQQGRLFLTLYLSQFAHGFAHTFVYMLRDDPAQGYWGFVHTNYTMKPSGEYLHRLTTILGAPGDEVDSQGSSLPLNYSILAQPDTVHDTLFVKPSGAFMLAVWSERANDVRQSVEVDLGEAYRTIHLYDPTKSSEPQQTLSNVRKMQLQFKGFHALVIEVVPHLV